MLPTPGQKEQQPECATDVAEGGQRESDCKGEDGNPRSLFAGSEELVRCPIESRKNDTAKLCWFCGETRQAYVTVFYDTSSSPQGEGDNGEPISHARIGEECPLEVEPDQFEEEVVIKNTGRYSTKFDDDLRE